MVVGPLHGQSRALDLTFKHRAFFRRPGWIAIMTDHPVVPYNTYRFVRPLREEVDEYGALEATQ